MDEALSRKFLLQSITTSFIDSQIASHQQYRPQLLLNDPPRQKVLTTLIHELHTCTSFRFSVAFVTVRGLYQLHQALLDAMQRGVRGQILTSDYLGFTDPDALRSIQRLYPNIDLRVYCDKAFHAKGYMFDHGDYHSVVVGSSNLTDNALSVNREWNVMLHSLPTGELMGRVNEEFSDAWNQAHDVTDAWLAHYDIVHAAKLSACELEMPATEKTPEDIVPNAMQAEALASLAALRSQGVGRALLISATGTGKTYLSAFDLKASQAKRFLFIVHRETVARSAMESFRNVMGPTWRCGMLGGGETTNEPNVFAMVQTLSKESTLAQLATDRFDYIVVDEVHHAAAGSYQRILEHFAPKFILGMTATPERSDGFDIYSLFDHNIAYQIRLNQALEADMLCPFHYFGVSDLTINGVVVDDKTTFGDLVSEERVARIDEVIRRYTLDTLPHRGLIFCSRVEEARRLSDELNLIGYRTVSLGGSDDDSLREAAIARLASDGDDHLDYILTVDIFNEGVDIPCLNQILMLRPTQSAIVFVQQLGRGLRKAPGKHYVTVIDFIGNYDNNFLIPVALFGNNTYQKDSLRRQTSCASLGIAGVSTIDFDKVTMERVFQSITHAKFDSLKLLRDAYRQVYIQLGKIPTMMDFVRLQSISPQLFIDSKGSYHGFLLSIGEDVPHICDGASKSLLFFSHILAPGLRPHEGAIVEALLASMGNPVSIDSVQEAMQRTYPWIERSTQALESALQVLSNGHYLAKNRRKFGEIAYCTWSNGLIYPTATFLELLENGTYRDQLQQVLAYGTWRFEQRDKTLLRAGNLFLNDTYTRQQVLLLLGWKEEVVSLNIGGYIPNYEKLVIPIFVTYHKDSENIDSGINYQDGFVSPQEFIWQSKNKRTLQSPEIQCMASQATNHVRLPLFVKKDDSEGGLFYYLGDMRVQEMEQQQIRTGQGTDVSIVQVSLRMQDTVEEGLYRYIIGYDVQ